VAVLRAAGVRLSGLSIVDAHEAALALLQTGRAPGPAEYWRALLEQHDCAPQQPGAERQGTVTDTDAWKQRMIATGMAVDGAARS